MALVGITADRGSRMGVETRRALRAAADLYEGSESELTVKGLNSMKSSLAAPLDGELNWARTEAERNRKPGRRDEGRMEGSRTGRSLLSERRKTRRRAKLEGPPLRGP